MDEINIIDAQKLRFKRYLGITRRISSGIVVFIDENKDYQKYCVDKYIVTRLNK